MLHISRRCANRALSDPTWPLGSKLIRQVYGIGCTKKKVDELARDLTMPRRRLNETLKATLQQLADAR